MRQATRRSARNNAAAASLAALTGALLALTGCGAPATPYYAARPAMVVVAPASQSTTHYVYSTINANSTNTTHITSESTVHVYGNQPAVQPGSVSQTTDETQTQTTEPTAPEEQQDRAEPATEPTEPAEPVVDTPAEPSEPAAETPAEPEPAADTGSSDAGDTNK